MNNKFQQLINERISLYSQQESAIKNIKTKITQSVGRKVIAHDLSQPEIELLRQDIRNEYAVRLENNRQAIVDYLAESKKRIFQKIAEASHKPEFNETALADNLMQKYRGAPLGFETLLQETTLHVENETNSRWAYLSALLGLASNDSQRTKVAELEKMSMSEDERKLRQDYAEAEGLETRFSKFLLNEAVVLADETAGWHNAPTYSEDVKAEMLKALMDILNPDEV